jgi:hypothetical protein
MHQARNVIGSPDVANRRGSVLLDPAVENQR